MPSPSFEQRPVSEWLAEINDLHSRVHDLERANAALQHTVDDLRLSGERNRVLLDESSDPIFCFNCDGEYQYVNNAFAQGVGRPMQDIIGQRIWDVFPKDEADKRFAVVKWVFENGQTRVIEVRVPRPDGDRYYVTTAKPILDGAGVATSVICISKEITERKRGEDRLARMAQHDPLTELPNRILFSDRVGHAIANARRDRTRLALMVLDLDKFKVVNDTFGHHIGDLLLQSVASRLQACIRAVDTVARMGGDEFLVLLPLVEQQGDARLVAEKICSSLSQPFELSSGHRLNIAVSVGIAMHPEHGQDELQLTRNADHAMYQAKADPHNAVRLFQGVIAA